jgi:alcohol dehydrogenase class IV
MQKKLLICSKSTNKYSSDFQDFEKFIFHGKIGLDLYKNFKNKYNHVVAIGGGGCMDLGKIATKEELICFPTTASGASQTSHSVVWDEQKKLSIKTTKPTEVIVKEEYIKNIPEKVLRDTFCDAVSHNLDVLYSLRKTPESEKYANQSLEMLKNNSSIKEIIVAGNLAGNAIEITPTTLLHSLSYPITGRYGIPHGQALGLLLKKMKSFYNFDIERYYKIEEVGQIDYNFVVDEGYKYDKVKNFSGKINKQDVKKMLSGN